MHGVHGVVCSNHTVPTNKINDLEEDVALG